MYSLIKVNKENHLILLEEDPPACSLASAVLLRNLYILQEKRGRNKNPEWRIWLNFRNTYIRKQKKLNKGNLVCSYCGAQKLDPNYFNPHRKCKRKRATIDHKIATSKGGKRFNEENLCVCCHVCNNRKKDQNPEQFIKRLSKLTR